jgi:hypothetical protein
MIHRIRKFFENIMDIISIYEWRKILQFEFVYLGFKVN